MRKLLAILIATAFVCAFTPMVLADEETIVVTLTPGGTADITVAPGTQDGEGATIGTTGTSGVTDFNLSNVGTIPVDVTIEATDTDAWTLEAAADHNMFQLNYNITVWTAIGTGPAAFTGDLPAEPGGIYYVLFGLQVIMPTSTSTNAAQETTITFTGTAA